MTESYNGDFNWDENWFGEPVADYSSFSKSQFLEDIGRRLTNVMLRCLTVCRVLPNRYEAQHFSHQLIRSLSSFAANFRAVRRSRSSKEYFAKLSLVIEELDESLFWLETLVAAQLVPEQRLADLIDEG